MRVAKIPPFGRDKDFSVTSFLRNDKIEERITAYQLRDRNGKSKSPVAPFVKGGL